MTSEERRLVFVYAKSASIWNEINHILRLFDGLSLNTPRRREIVNQIGNALASIEDAKSLLETEVNSRTTYENCEVLDGEKTKQKIFVVKRQKIGKLWHESENAEPVTIFFSPNLLLATEFVADDIEDSMAKWPELKNGDFCPWRWQQKDHGYHWRMGQEDFRIEYALLEQYEEKSDEQ